MSNSEDVTFVCENCKKIAVSLSLRSVDTKNGDDSLHERSRIVINGLFGEVSLYQTRDGEAIEDLFLKIRELHKTNLKELHLLDHDSFGFICRGCGFAYCKNCWQNVIPIFDNGIFDEYRGTCPKGHEQMLQD